MLMPHCVGLKFYPQSVIRTLNRFCSIVEQMCSRFIEGVAGYIEMKWLCRSASGLKRLGSVTAMANLSKCGIMTDSGLWKTSLKTRSKPKNVTILRPPKCRKPILGETGKGNATYRHIYPRTDTGVLSVKTTNTMLR
ncbi:hypothetical protein [Prevotella sp. OH937_COT-195]|uniref:hypothetical protein n=1 Tax=Prevotella sp. OH937_COT-195 TaxID=2491051 RepID=UPI000F649AFB|nr:hypothetical protein [Prevotella sp. OH937_COT-195]RRD02594.1 hypothetical protein EII32_02765 [Prevotella sp. OH937_COT-195]